MAIAEPGHSHGEAGSDHDKGDKDSDKDTVADAVRPAFDVKAGGSDSESVSELPRHPRWGNGRPPQGTPTKETTKPPCPGDGDDQPPGETPPPPQSAGGGGGGGGGAAVALPRYTPPRVPDMVLPDQLNPSQPGDTAALDAGANAVAVAPVGPAAPIALPVIVAPPLGLGVGARGAGPVAGPPTAPRAMSAQPPAGRIPPPANVGSAAASSHSTYRVGYSEYLRGAGLPQVAALAVPGVVGILVLTGAGGLMGYRQARAGHAVRTGGSARFMR
ncbi:hypothetical protein [Mycobacterium sp. 1274761.0]|uniref:hypothetical protein n=1 Tax=Mycobacterium sp. 1274761.0 TaxID=1834077 RepID=UPI000A5D3C29|nr:hypothetical protein [Mycobacterium sp. 1274761.0]